ncbi:SIS domain-containing protein [Nocardia terpenica]|uniref:Glucosamine-6-phosphate deaminase n=2 Tax=Nocardia terpenica TaxID=455432 RepID=A0A164MMY3_9NOCA|nr:SIS domain-containing protein [Nocardia terpenica]KZM73505.1 glucosamine-6-phosphate deaminase [Nocardia terpenica]MBF6065708.1 SIS domain-containing protein [Nocardia terpenica]MBF6108254.1 SIS domain-containing protein [Nocardia terpenica]MBF6115823.1 SIS domain-containing protein [Nocardia terpenica]
MTDMDKPGALMAAEIAEQPAAWQRLLGEGTDAIRKAAARIADYRPRFVLFVARGTSDHAALYGKYLVEIHHALPAGLVSPSTMTVYGTAPDLRDVLFVAVSQSGGSPDLVQSVEVARRQGALTVALTNNPDSALAAAAEVHVDILAGAERAVAATKSYTAELLALYLMLDYARGGDGRGTAELPALGTRVLESDAAVAAIAGRYRFAQRMITSARGYSYPTAREAALKLMETSYLSAQAFSGADLLHGPLATIDPSVPVLAIVPEGAGGRAMRPVLARLAELRADVVGIGAAEAISGLTGGVALPIGVPEPLSPLLEILPLQQLALHLAIARGGDPDRPRGLKKVTETL